MSEFTPIQTQEEFDKAIKGRLAQKDRELEEKYKEYLSPEKVSELKKDYEKKLADSTSLVKEAQEKLKTFDTTVSELTKRAEAAEKTILKTKIAYDHKLPMELANRLVGETEEELSKDAESLSKIVSTGQTPPPYTREVNRTGGSSSKDAAMLNLLTQLTQQTN